MTRTTRDRYANRPGRCKIRSSAALATISNKFDVLDVSAKFAGNFNPRELTSVLYDRRNEPPATVRGGGEGREGFRLLSPDFIELGDRAAR